MGGSNTWAESNTWAGFARPRPGPRPKMTLVALFGINLYPLAPIFDPKWAEVAPLDAQSASRPPPPQRTQVGRVPNLCPLGAHFSDLSRPF